MEISEGLVLHHCSETSSFLFATQTTGLSPTVTSGYLAKLAWDTGTCNVGLCGVANACTPDDCMVLAMQNTRDPRVV